MASKRDLLEQIFQVVTNLQQEINKMATNQQTFDVDLGQLGTDFTTVINGQQAQMTLIQQLITLVQALIAKGTAAGIDLTTEDTAVKSMDSSAQALNASLATATASINTAIASLQGTTPPAAS